MLEKRVVGLIFAKHDIAAAAAACEMFLDHPASRKPLDSQHQALVDAVVSAYCRPFMKGQSMLPPEWPGYGKPEWQTQHARLLRLRRVFVGHSDPEERRITIHPSREQGTWRTRLNLPWVRAGELERTKAMCEDIWLRLDTELRAAVGELFEREKAQLGHLPLSLTLPR